MSILLAVDPSIRSPGAAIFVSNELAAACVLKLEDIGGDIGHRTRYASRRICDWARATGLPVTSATVLIYEWPQIYAAAKSKGDPNDLPGLAAVGAGVAAMMPWHSSILTPTPREWTGGVPKSTKGDPWLSARGIRIASRLSEKELSLVPKSHDAIDAVGLGLFALGRFQRRRVISRG